METQNTQLQQREATDLSDNAIAGDTIVLTPPVDIYENSDEILLVADFPGVPRESLDIQLNGGELRIQGSQPDTGDQGARAVRFMRAFRVPNTVEPEGVDAELAQGVLKVHLKKSEAAKPRRIEVKSS